MHTTKTSKTKILQATVFVAVFAVLGVAYLLFSRAATVNKSSDLNGDGTVNIYDLGILLGDYGKTGAYKGDLNNDGTVNIYDLGILLGNYGKGVITFSPGIVSGSAHAYSLQGFKAVGGVRYARMEWDITTSASTMQQDFTDYADAGISVLPLAGFNGYMPTDTQVQNLSNWATMYGPGGSFWVTREQNRKTAGLPDDSNLAPKFIEFGNETNGLWQYGDTSYTSASYVQRAKDYALRFKTAQTAIQSSNPNVGLLAIADDGSEGSTTWDDNLFLAVPDMAARAAGWTIHPYGPFDCTASYTAFPGCSTTNTYYYANKKILRMIQQLSSHGVSNTAPIDITEYGIATNNGVALNDNYGWPTNLTYTQAATYLDNTVMAMRNSPDYGSRIRFFMYYGIMDLNFGNPGSTAREDFFGAVNTSFGDKGDYTVEIRKIMKM